MPEVSFPVSVDHVLRHELLRGLRAAAKLIEKTREVDASDLTDDEHAEVDEVLTRIIQDAIRIRSRLGGPTDVSSPKPRG